MCNFTARYGTGAERAGGGSKEEEGALEKWGLLRGDGGSGGGGGGKSGGLDEGGGCRVIEVSLVAERMMTGPDCVWFRLWQL